MATAAAALLGSPCQGIAGALCSGITLRGSSLGFVFGLDGACQSSIVSLLACALGMLSSGGSRVGLLLGEALGNCISLDVSPAEVASVASD